MCVIQVTFESNNILRARRRMMRREPTFAPNCRIQLRLNNNVLGGFARAVIFPPMVHAGIGYDVHQIAAGRKLILGGVEIPHSMGLEGHSDADVLMHAVCDAVLGALGEPDIGHFFPNTDPRWRGAPSKVFLEEAARQAKFREARIVNVDATIIAQQPKLAPHIKEMKINIAAALGLNMAKVGVKATTNEHLGFIGREEGIAAMAVATVDIPEAPEIK
jgi:2-C-methyl-D-erythritol 2,4-cyclodiphosphate synthase